MADVDDKVLLAEGLMKTNQPREALEIVQSILRENPDHTDALLIYGKSCLASGQGGLAKSAFEKVLMLDSKNGQARFFLGRFAVQAGQLPQAEKLFCQAMVDDASFIQTPMQLANVLHQQGKHFEALKVLADAEKQFPDHSDFTHARGHIAIHIAPTWHLPMLADQARNDAYEKAINVTVKTGDIVLDIGAGSGLLSLMAARAGAAHVYACEANPLLAALAQDIVSQNGFEDKITIITKHSTALEIGRELPQKADVLVTEIFDNALLGEGAIPTLRHAHQHLLKSEAQIIPQDATLYGVLSASPHIQAFHRTDNVNNFDLSAMTLLAHPLSYKDADVGFMDDTRNCLLTAPFVLQHYNFLDTPPEQFEQTCEVKILDSATADTILMWFSLTLSEGVIFSTETVGAHQHWRQVYQPLQKPYPCNAGDTLRLKSRYDRYFEFSLTQ